MRAGIKRCKCGCRAYVFHEEQDGTRYAFVECWRCNNGTDYYTTEEEAIKAWNKGEIYEPKQE